MIAKRAEERKRERYRKTQGRERGRSSGEFTGPTTSSPKRAAYDCDYAGHYVASLRLRARGREARLSEWTSEVGRVWVAGWRAAMAPYVWSHRALATQHAVMGQPKAKAERG